MAAPREELLAQARTMLADARLEGQRQLRVKFDEARKRGDYDRARRLAHYVYRSGGRLLEAIDREEREARRRRR